MLPKYNNGTVIRLTFSFQKGEVGKKEDVMGPKVSSKPSKTNFMRSKGQRMILLSSMLCFSDALGSHP